MEETRVAIIAIVVEDKSKANELNNLLTEYGDYIRGKNTRKTFKYNGFWLGKFGDINEQLCKKWKSFRR